VVMRAAVFSDVEGTLVDGGLPSMSLAIGRRMGMFSRWQMAQVVAIALTARALPGDLRRRVQVGAVVRSMAGHTVAEAERLVDALIPEALARIKPAMLERLRAHQRAGLPLVLVSGGMHPAIVRLGVALGGRGEGTTLVQRAGRYLARLEGPVCQGEGKASRARAIIAEIGCDPALSYAYGDTASDIPFLALFGHPNVVDPDTALAAVAQRRGWPIVRNAAAVVSS
jgi:HAD superfamily phosphoserine phosphatase-like hydrolase